jgi:hypothetical protein
VFSGLDPIHPAVNVVGFFQAVGRQLAAAVAVSARIREQNHVMVLDQPLPVTVSAHPVVRDTVQQNDGIAVWRWRSHEPGTQDGAIGSRKFHIAELDPICLSGLSRVTLLAGSHEVTVGV